MAFQRLRGTIEKLRVSPPKLREDWTAACNVPSTVENT